METVVTNSAVDADQALMPDTGGNDNFAHPAMQGGIGAYARFVTAGDAPVESPAQATVTTPTGETAAAAHPVVNPTPTSPPVAPQPAQNAQTTNQSVTPEKAP